MLRKELNFSKGEFQALPWTDQKMYIDQLSIFLYLRDHANWKQLSDEEKYYYEEPQPPQCYIDEVEDDWEEEKQIVAPDILGG